MQLLLSSGGGVVVVCNAVQTCERCIALQDTGCAAAFERWESRGSLALGALGAALPQQGRQTQLAPRLQILLGAPIFHNYESN